MMMEKADVTLVCKGGSTVMANGYALSKLAPFFSNLKDYKEGQTGEVNMERYHQESVQMLVDYCHMQERIFDKRPSCEGDVEKMVKIRVDLYILADFLQIPTLKEYTFSDIKKRIAGSPGFTFNAMEYLATQTEPCDELKTECVRFIRSAQFVTTLSKAHWKTLKFKFFYQVLNDPHLRVREIELLKLLVWWHDKLSFSKPQFKVLLGKIEFRNIDTPDLIKLHKDLDAEEKAELLDGYNVLGPLYRERLEPDWTASPDIGKARCHPEWFKTNAKNTATLSHARSRRAITVPLTGCPVIKIGDKTQFVLEVSGDAVGEIFLGLVYGTPAPASSLVQGWSWCWSTSGQVFHQGVSSGTVVDHLKKTTTRGMTVAFTCKVDLTEGGNNEGGKFEVSSDGGGTWHTIGLGLRTYLTGKNGGFSPTVRLPDLNPGEKATVGVTKFEELNGRVYRSYGLPHDEAALLNAMEKTVPHQEQETE